MAAFVFTDAFVEVASINLSDHVQQVALDLGAELQDDTVMGFAARSSIPGLLTAGGQVTFLQDYAAAEVDATIFPLVGTKFAVEFRPTSGGRSATNPGYTNTVTIPDAGYRPLGGSVGDMATATLNLANASSTGWQRQTT